MTRDHVRMRLVDDVRVRRAGANALKQFQIGRETAATRLDSAVVFDLTRHENVAALARRAIEFRAALPVFTEAGRDDDPLKLSGSGQQVFGKLTSLQQLFELAGLRRVEMSAKTINGDRKRRNAIGTEAAR